MPRFPTTPCQSGERSLTEARLRKQGVATMKRRSTSPWVGGDEGHGAGAGQRLATVFHMRNMM